MPEMEERRLRPRQQRTDGERQYAQNPWENVTLRKERETGLVSGRDDSAEERTREDMFNYENKFDSYGIWRRFDGMIRPPATKIPFRKYGGGYSVSGHSFVGVDG